MAPVVQVSLWMAWQEQVHRDVLHEPVDVTRAQKGERSLPRFTDAHDVHAVQVEPAVITGAPLSAVDTGDRGEGEPRGQLLCPRQAASVAGAAPKGEASLLPWTPDCSAVSSRRPAMVPWACGLVRVCIEGLCHADGMPPFRPGTSVPPSPSRTGGAFRMTFVSGQLEDSRLRPGSEEPE